MTAKVPRSTTAAASFVDKACANPACVFAAHADAAEFQGYCCRKCLWSEEGGFGIPEHGPQCCRRRPWRGPMPSSWKPQEAGKTTAAITETGKQHDEATLDSLLAAASGDTSDYHIQDMLGAGSNRSSAPHHPSSSSTSRPSPVFDSKQSESSPGTAKIEEAMAADYNAQEAGMAAAERRRDPALGDWITFTELKERYGYDYSRHKMRRYWELFCLEEKKYDEEWIPLTWKDFRAKYGQTGGGSSSGNLAPEELRRKWRQLPWVEEDPEALAAKYQAACLDDENDNEIVEELGLERSAKEESKGASSTLAVSKTRHDVEVGQQAVLAALRPEEAHSGYLKKLGSSAAASTANWLDDWENAAAAAGFT